LRGRPAGCFSSGLGHFRGSRIQSLPELKMLSQTTQQQSVVAPIMGPTLRNVLNSGGHRIQEKLINLPPHHLLDPLFPIEASFFDRVLRFYVCFCWSSIRAPPGTNTPGVGKDAFPYSLGSHPPIQNRPRISLSHASFAQ
jgi:hypothetical protein